MITLSNGDRWIIDDKEWEDANIPYEEAIKGNIPETSAREFIEELFNNQDDLLLPRKLTDWEGGYWDCNFFVGAVLDDVAVRKVANSWSSVYEMPWGHVYIMYDQADSGGYDVEMGFEKFENVDEYMKKVSFD